MYVFFKHILKGKFAYQMKMFSTFAQLTCMLGLISLIHHLLSLYGGKGV